MARLSEALASLRPKAEWADINNTYEGVVWHDAVQVKPTREEVEAEIVRLEAATTRISVKRLYFMLGVAEEEGLKGAIEALLNGMAEGGNELPLLYWQNAEVFESDHPLMLQLGQHPYINKDAAAIRALCAAAYDKQLAGAA